MVTLNFLIIKHLGSYLWDFQYISSSINSHWGAIEVHNNVIASIIMKSTTYNYNNK